MNHSHLRCNQWVIPYLLIILGRLSACTRGPLDALAHFGSGTPEHSASRLHGKNILNSYTDSYALLIGESNYTRWSSLDSVPGELQRVEEMLKSQGFQVETWLDINAAELRARFEQFISTYGLDEKNRLLFYFGGHGHTRQYQGLNKGYIVPIDAPDPNVDEKGFVRKAVSMDDIYAWAKRIEANHALFVFDSCFSGTIFKVRSDKKMPEYIRASAAEPVRQFITAGRAGETVPAQSVFTPIFIDALKDGDGDLNGDGYVTGAELGYHLASKVPDHNAQQHPQFGTIKDYELSRGDFVFVVDSGSQREQTSQSQSLSTVVPRVKPDSDRDGVNDDEDNCPENGAAELVKGVYKQGPQTGCPLDSDQDRVADYQDSCPYNQPNEIANGVNSNGCPRDTDRDGVADYRDHCPRNQRPEIIQGVSKRGCPVDKDHDGVADYQDACSGTPAGVTVNKTGCHQSVRFVSMSPGTVFRDRLQNGGQGPEMVVVPAGRFQMEDLQGDGDGDEKPVHWVSVKQFAVGRYEVTVGEFRQFVKMTGYQTDAEKGDGCYVYKDGSWDYVKDANWRNPYFSQQDKQPVVCLSWNDASAYAQWLTQQTGKPYRLPTEAQWEYAARAGTTTSRYWGNHPDEACRYANVHDKTSKQVNGFSWPHHDCTDGYAKTAPVGSFQPNGFGLFDVLGNVWEWTCSGYESSYEGAEQRCVDKGDSSLRALRGGAWGTKPWSVRAADRSRDSRDNRYNYVGLRLARLL